MDASRFYALLRFEEAALALRAAMQMRLIDQMGTRSFSRDELRDELGFTEQAARTYFALLVVMEILECHDGSYRVTPVAAQCLADGIQTSRKPYLSMGNDDSTASLIQLMRNELTDDSLPFYGSEGGGPTVMDETEIAREIALGLASRARNFAGPLVAAMAECVGSAKTLADIGAGSPYVGHASLQAYPGLESAKLVDRANAMRFVHEIIRNEQIDAEQMEFHEGDFFEAVPAADLYVVSNTAHDWRPPEYSKIANNIRAVMPSGGVVCIHEPLMMASWKDESEWWRALWMSCYALTLFRLTLGEGTCYTMEEHHAILARSGFVPKGLPVATIDGCTALFYELQQ